MPSHVTQTCSSCSARTGWHAYFAGLACVARVASPSLSPRDGSIRYGDFLRELEEGADVDEMHHQSPLRGSSSSSWKPGGSDGRNHGISTERGRLGISLGRAIERGIDYRREMELEEERARGGRETGVKEGIVSRQT